MNEKISLIFVVLGSLLFTLSDTDITLDGLQYLFLNYFVIILTPFFEKSQIKEVKEYQTDSGIIFLTLGITFIRNLLSIPMLILLLFMNGRLFNGFNELQSLPFPIIFYIILTCGLIYLLNISSWYLSNLPSNSKIIFSNITIKFMALLISLLIWGPSFHINGWIGIIISFLGILWFRFKGETLIEKKKNRNLFFFFISSLLIIYFINLFR
jgi:hypothetical protein